MMGAERRSMVMTEDEKKLTAYHEGGHAIVMLYAPGHEPLHKVTIIPRGRALGLTMYLPERDRLSISERELKAKITSLFGGRVAEEMIFGKENITTGASNDIKVATDLARRMVTQFGFSDKLGPLLYGENDEEVFLGHSVTQRKNVSDTTAALIDEEIRRLIDEGEAAARRILEEHADELELLGQALLEHETLSADEVRTVIKGGSINRDEGDEPERPAPPRQGASVPTTEGGGAPGGATPEPQPGS